MIPVDRILRVQTVTATIVQTQPQDTGSFAAPRCSRNSWFPNVGQSCSPGRDAGA